MPLETGTTIAELDQSWPLGGDFVLDGDNHLRLIKAVLKAQFPGAGGQGFNTVILASEEELNWLRGLTSNVQDQLDALANDDNLKAPAGTIMAFANNTPPNGWVIMAHDNRMLRTVSSNGGGTGGVDSPISWASTHNHGTGNWTLTEAQMPVHNHNVPDGGNFMIHSSNGNRTLNANSDNEVGTYPNTGNRGGGASHNHGQTGNASPQFQPRYINIIMAIKA